MECITGPLFHASKSKCPPCALWWFALCEGTNPKAGPAATLAGPPAAVAVPAAATTDARQTAATAAPIIHLKLI